MDHPTARPLGEHGHETVAAVEGNDVQPARRRFHCNLAREGQKRALHRVALDRPDPVSVMQSRVVAQGGGAGEC